MQQTMNNKMRMAYDGFVFIIVSVNVMEYITFDVISCLPQALLNYNVITGWTGHTWRASRQRSTVPQTQLRCAHHI